MTDTNTAVGVNALGALPTGVDNTALGANALKSATSSTPIQNVAVGSGAGSAVTSGANNVIIGYGSAPSLTTGSGNIIIGDGADVPTGVGGTNNYLNIGNAIFGSMATGGALSLFETPAFGDNTTKIATTAFVQSTISGGGAGAMVKLGSGSRDTGVTGLIDFRTLVTNNNPPTYTQLELRLTNIISSSQFADLTAYFVNQGTSNTGNNYLLSSGGGQSNTDITSAPPVLIPYSSHANNWTDGSATLVLSGFSNSNSSVTPSLWFESRMQFTGTTAGSCLANLSSGLICCNQVAGLPFDGLNFVTSGDYTFNWALYGIL
jgi:hypothetical protein